jgi:hypothetical protein
MFEAVKSAGKIVDRTQPAINEIGIVFKPTGRQLRDGAYLVSTAPIKNKDDLEEVIQGILVSLEAAKKAALGMIDSQP